MFENCPSCCSACFSGLPFFYTSYLVCPSCNQHAVLDALYSFRNRLFPVEICQIVIKCVLLSSAYVCLLAAAASSGVLACIRPWGCVGVEAPSSSVAPGGATTQASHTIIRNTGNTSLRTSHVVRWCARAQPPPVGRDLLALPRWLPCIPNMGGGAAAPRAPPPLCLPGEISFFFFDAEPAQLQMRDLKEGGQQWSRQGIYLK